MTKIGRGIKTVEPIRDIKKVEAIKLMLTDKPRDYLLFVLGINFALRIGDLLALKVGDVLDNGQVKDHLTIKEEKTGKAKRITVNESAKEALVGHFKAVGDRPDGEYLFKSMRSDKPLDKVTAWKMINQWCKAVGVKDNCGTHTLRKTWGYHARKQGVSLELIQAKFGHSSPAITRRYIGITADEIADVEDLVSL